MAGALSRTPLEKLIALPRPPSWLGGADSPFPRTPSAPSALWAWVTPLVGPQYSVFRAVPLAASGDAYEKV